jgi:hypothetical protein
VTADADVTHETKFEAKVRFSNNASRGLPPKPAQMPFWFKEPSPLPSCCPDSAPHNGTRGNAVERDGIENDSDVATLKAKCPIRKGFQDSQTVD